ncbi:MAG: subclass B3 metallo-beta-lactamase [Gemmatimonadaceae bacterium]|nr:subclass B3 metallo-beta-lactamase [Gemmatimonadaceae bacterium]
MVRRARVWRRTIAAVVGAVGSVMAAVPATAQVNRPGPWTDTIAPFRVIGNIHYVGSAGLSAWLITSPEGHILIDVGLPENAAMVERNITALGFRLADVKYLLNTHAHLDHSGGMAQLKRSTGARVMAMAGDRAALERGVYIGSEQLKAFHFPPVRVDRVLRDRETVTLGGTTLTANLTPGHSAGCTSWTMPLEVDGGRHSVIFFCSASVAGNRLAPRPQYPGIVADYRQTFRRLRTMDGDILLAPHAEMFDLRAKRAALEAQTPGQLNPFIVPGEFRSLAAELEAGFATELARQRALARP